MPACMHDNSPVMQPAIPVKLLDSHSEHPLPVSLLSQIKSSLVAAMSFPMFITHWQIQIEKCWVTLTSLNKTFITHPQPRPDYLPQTSFLFFPCFFTSSKHSFFLEKHQFSWNFSGFSWKNTSFPGIFRVFLGIFLEKSAQKSRFLSPPYEGKRKRLFGFICGFVTFFTNFFWFFPQKIQFLHPFSAKSIGKSVFCLDFEGNCLKINPFFHH